MAETDNKTAVKNARLRNYLARDFNGFRTVLLEYARQYYPDRIQDFSEASLGGLFLDMAAYVGDNMSFYLDHLYNELNFDTVVETKNAETIIRNAGIPIVGSSPSLVYVDFYIEVPVTNTVSIEPDLTLLPTIQAGAVLRSDNGTQFTLTEDVHFWEQDDSVEIGIKVARDVDVTNGKKINGNIVTKVLRKQGLCTSGAETTQSFSVGGFIAFRRLTLGQPDVTKVMNVVDGYGNVYYEVDNLSHDVVYRNVLNTTEKDALVKDSLKVIPAPFRFTSATSLSNRRTTLTFGGGNADTLEDDIIPDPSEFALPLPFSQTFSRVAINPQKLLQTTTLGVAASNTTLNVTYRYGGGLSHNVAPGTIRDVVTVSMVFPENPLFGLQQNVKSSLEVINQLAASGGEDPPTTDELLALVPAVKYSQERIVTKEDMLARVYAMPSNFGRVFRAAVSRNPNNPLATQLFVISRDASEVLVPATDALKINLKRYLNSYRMISDAIDVLDAAVINLEIFFQIVVDPSYNKVTIIQNIIKDLQDQFNIKNFHINQPLIISDIVSVIFSRTGVIAVDKVQVKNIYGTVKNRVYSPIPFDVQLNTKNQIVYPPTGAIFEIRYPDINIVGKAVSNV
jgi:hypothetical protein